MSASIEVHPEVRDALGAGRPVVALESAVLTTGLPATPLDGVPEGVGSGWRADRPACLEAVRLMERAVRAAGAVPATVGVVAGRLRVGLDDEGLGQLAEEGRGHKVSVHDLASAVARGGTAGTTVAATLAACGLAGSPPIRVMATGGIGGVHRGWTGRLDVSADLVQLARTPVCVVCSGVKALLDVEATCELLETLGVPLVGHGTGELAMFYCRGGGLEAPLRCDDARSAAGICLAHWALSRRSAVVIANPVPEPLGLDPARHERLVAEAEAEADRRAVAGPHRTPFVLSMVADRIGPAAVVANVALLERNAGLAGEIAAAIAAGGS